MKKYVLSLVFSLLLSGCAFHFRRTEDIPPKLQTVYIQTVQPQSELTSQLSETFQGLGVNIVKHPKEAPITLSILQDSFTQSYTLLGSAQQLNSAILTYTVSLVLTDPRGKNLTVPVTLSTQMTYWQSANQILGDTTALPVFKQTLAHAMIQKILAYLNAESTRNAL